jgi:uncharacterized protein YndB with AHSA1/START domain
MDATDSTVLERQIHIEAKPETVFQFFTDPSKLVRWMGITAQINPQQGGIYRVEVTKTDIVRGEYLEVKPPKRVVFSWGWEGENSPLPPGASTVEVILAADGEGTLLTLRHLGLPVPLQKTHAEGWDHYLPRLAQVSEGKGPGVDAWTM